MSIKIMRFTAEWCEVCADYLPTFVKVMSEFPDAVVESYDIETDDGVEMASDFGITGVPTTIVVDDAGYQIKVGNVPYQVLKEMLDERSTITD